MDKINVKKRDGALEAWSYDKLVASMSKAGIPLEEAEGYAKTIESWAKENATDEVIVSTKIRDKVIETVKTDYPAEADSYQVYKKS